MHYFFTTRFCSFSRVPSPHKALVSLATIINFLAYNYGQPHWHDAALVNKRVPSTIGFRQSEFTMPVAVSFTSILFPPRWGVRLFQHGLLFRLRWGADSCLRDGSLRAQRYRCGRSLRNTLHSQLWHRRSLPAQPCMRWKTKMLHRRQHRLLRRPVWIRGVSQGHLPMHSRSEYRLQSILNRARRLTCV